MLHADSNNRGEYMDSETDSKKRRETKRGKNENVHASIVY